MTHRNSSVKQTAQSEDAEDDTILLNQQASVSPSKSNGILLTPGTAQLRRTKSVTFGAEVDEKPGRRYTRPSRSGLPDTCPGKFPSPWTSIVDKRKDNERAEATKPGSPPSEASQDARNTAASIGQHDDAKPRDGQDKSAGSHPTGGLDWKHRYEDYADRTQREMKKLIAKQKAAKSFARDRDTKAVDLADKLRQEQKKVARLEAQISELSAQLMQYQGHMKHQQKGEAIHARQEGRTGAQPLELRAGHFAIENNPSQVKVKPDNVTKATEACTRSPKRPPQPSPKEDIWADAIFSSPIVTSIARKSAQKTKAQSNSRPTQASENTPLVTRSINTLGQPQTSPSISAKRAKTPQSIVPKTDRRTPRSTMHSNLDLDDLDEMPALPQPSPEPLNSVRSTRTIERSTRKANRPSPIKPFEASSPFMSSPPRFDPHALPYSFPSPPKIGYVDTTREKENARPNAGKVGFRGTGEMDQVVIDVAEKSILENGKKISHDRAAKAKERIAARRREKGKLETLVA